MIAAVDLEQLAALVFAEGQRHPACTPERRAHGALWAALITVKSVGAVRAALEGFTSPDVAAAALELLETALSASCVTVAAASPRSPESSAGRHPGASHGRIAP